VLGKIDHLDIWNEDRFAKRIAEEAITEQDLLQLSELGI
jgi:DNA-binding transcriptional regulator/RsmH inhibitor MraZ